MKNVNVETAKSYDIDLGDTLLADGEELEGVIALDKKYAVIEDDKIKVVCDDRIGSGQTVMSFTKAELEAMLTEMNKA